MARIIETRVSDVTDPELLRLFEDLEYAIGLSPDRDQWIFHYLTQFVYPLGGAEARRPISKNEINPVGILSSKLGKFKDGPIYLVCDEIARINGQTAELWEERAIYIFLNKNLPDSRKSRKKKPDIWNQIRRNLGD